MVQKKDCIEAMVVIKLCALHKAQNVASTEHFIGGRRVFVLLSSVLKMKNEVPKMYPADIRKSDTVIHTKIHLDAVLVFEKMNCTKITRQPMTEREHDTIVRQAVPKGTQPPVLSLELLVQSPQPAILMEDALPS